jgi:hypothetical protein
MLKKQLFLTALIFWFCVLMINILRSPAADFSIQEDAFWPRKISWKNRFDLVVAGDSRTLIGISPQAMQSVLPGYKIGNLGFVALVYSQEYMDYIRMTLHSPVKNDVIVIGFSPRSLLSNKKIECYFRMLYDEARIPLKMEFDRRSRWLKILFRKLYEDDLITPLKRRKSRYLMVSLESGWMASRLFPEDAGHSKAQYRIHFMKKKIDEKLLELIYRNTEAWTREGIKVFGIRIPTSPNIFVIEKEMSGFTEQNIRQRFEKSGGIWLNPSISYFVAYDGSHARYDSAVSYSKSLAEELKKFIGKKR